MCINFVIRDLYRLVLVSHFYYIYYIQGFVSREHFNADLDGLFFLTPIRIQIRIRIGALSYTKLISATDKIQTYGYRSRGGNATPLPAVATWAR